MKKFYLSYNLAMAIQINEISEKYINKLGKRYFNTVKLSEAAISIRNAVEETAEAAKAEIKEAVEPLKAKIAQKDEFISSQIKTNKGLEQENKKLQTRLEEYKPIIKEAYKQGITQEIQEKKNVLASILSGLIHHKEELVKPKAQPVKAAVKSIEEPVIKQQEIPQKTKKKKICSEASVKKTVISQTIIQKIEAQRKNQKLDKERIERASALIKILLEDAPNDSFEYKGVQEQFQKTMDKYVKAVNSFVKTHVMEKDGSFDIKTGLDENGKIILKQNGIMHNDNFHPYKYNIFHNDGSSMEIYDGYSDSYIEFRDKNGKEYLKICYGDHYSIFISDKNGRLMVSQSVRGGAVEYLSVDFSDVKPIAEIENDAPMNDYANRLIKKAKKDCISQEKEYRDTTDIDYLNSEGKITVHEYFVNKKKNSLPVFTYLFNPKTENLEKLISNGDFGIHGKLVDNGCGGVKLVQYRTAGITHLDKKREGSNLKDFSIGFYKSTENEHFEVQALYDENYKLDKDSFLQRPIFEKRNYGLASHPLTKSFTYHDLSKHQIKPWDLTILKPYL